MTVIRYGIHQVSLNTAFTEASVLFGISVHVWKSVSWCSCCLMLYFLHKKLLVLHIEVQKPLNRKLDKKKSTFFEFSLQHLDVPVSGGMFLFFYHIGSNMRNKVNKTKKNVFENNPLESFLKICLIDSVHFHNFHLFLAESDHEKCSVFCTLSPIHARMFHWTLKRNSNLYYTVSLPKLVNHQNFSKVLAHTYFTHFCSFLIEHIIWELWEFFCKKMHDTAFF